MCVAGEADADAEWTVVCASGDRLMTDGTTVAVDAPVSLIHVMSNVMLATCVSFSRARATHIARAPLTHTRPPLYTTRAQSTG